MGGVGARQASSFPPRRPGVHAGLPCLGSVGSVCVSWSRARHSLPLSGPSVSCFLTL